MLVVRYSIMWIPFILLFTAAAWGLELWEGNKITTTEYYGLRNLGFAFIAMMFLGATSVYPIAVAPFSMLVYKFVSSLLVRIVIYSVAGGASGIWIFHRLYDDYFVRGYGPQLSSSVLIFASAGLLYALIDHFFDVKKEAGRWRIGRG
ncbi:hypothetical protein [Paenibacillus sp. LHD-38]|uniref:hypothetical protein n=1 Tax=Paenibacillus sp. LHD-38 TaxID=3072143 RepID=UPI00280FAAC2|nr:hypothetical protein [Paenibacillus sp. LHD-38]MDQ8734385.1 hypothetical protein [Paenibacillus sp. LHD-38]